MKQLNLHRYCRRAACMAAAVVLTASGVSFGAASPKEDNASAILPTPTYSGEDFPVYYREALPVDASRARYAGFRPSTEILRAGTVRREGALPLPVDIRFDRDVAVTLRDGTTIYTDVYRPAQEGKYPAILCISPYGKQYGGQWLDDLPMRVGVPFAATSQLERFEGADPAYWVAQGYAVVNPDPRGAYQSEGNIQYWGRQYAEDGYDIVEWIAGQNWSNEKVGMSGNSWLTVSQWFIAAEQPPHLAAIAPWEGFVDHYRETSHRGGIPTPEFPELIAETFASARGLLEDQPRMIVEYPFLNAYWEDKNARLDRISIPAYVVASYDNPVHTHGTFAGFREIASPQKWLRVHDSHEWRDYYDPQNVADLKKFFDRYLKGVDNGWENTPKVRLSVLDPGGTNVVNRSENEFPLARTEYTKLYLDASNGELGRQAVAQSAQATYDSEGTAPQTSFTLRFAEDTELTGYMKLHLWVQANDSDDMDLAVTVEKLDRDGKPVAASPMGPTMATGQIRVSCRALDSARSTAAEPYLLGTSEQKLQPEEIVPVEIGIWPMGMIYHKGEYLRLTIGAYRPVPAEIPFGSAKISVPKDRFTFQPGEAVETVSLGGNAKEVANPHQVVTSPATHNRGRHTVYTGGTYDSFLLVPVIPPKNTERNSK